MKIKTVSIIGLGALGTMYANHFSKILPKDSLRVIANRKRIKKYTSEGVYCNDELCNFNYIPSDEIVEPTDLIIFTVKSTHLLEAIEDARNQIGENTIIISALNGISSEELLGNAYGVDKVLYCVAQGMDAVKEGNHLTYINMGKLSFGEKRNETCSEKVRSVAEFFESTSFPYEVPVDMYKRQWGKFMFNAGLNQVTAVFGVPYGGVQVSGEPREVMIKAMEEVRELSIKEGINLSKDDIKYWLLVLDTLTPSSKPSMLQDIEAKRPTEVELFAGTAIELGKKHGIPTPTNAWLYEKIKELENKYK
jgi:2-dehydropantoate 2-reductase